MGQEEERYGFLFLIVLSVVLTLVLVGILFGMKYVYSPSYPKLTYNNFEFRQQDRFWHTLWQRNDKLYTISLRYNPKEVESVPVFGVLNNTFNVRRQIYVAFDPLSEKSTFKYLALAASELTINLAGPLGKNIVAACTQNESVGCASRPVVSCENVDKNVIVLQANGTPQIALNGTCMVFSGSELDLVKSVDKALYLWMGIIPRPIAQLSILP